MSENEDEQRALAQHIVDNQIEPQRRVAELRKQGLDVETVVVSTDPEADGHLVTCFGCRRQARLPFAPPPGKGVLCPACQRDDIPPHDAR